MKKLFALLLAVVMVLSLAACGSSGKSEAPADEAPAAEAPAAEAPAAEAPAEEWKPTKTINIYMTHGSG